MHRMSALTGAAGRLAGRPPTHLPTVRIRASAVSSILGVDPYTPRASALADAWEHACPESYYRCLQRWRGRPDEDKFHASEEEKLAIASLARFLQSRCSVHSELELVEGGACCAWAPDTPVHVREQSLPEGLILDPGPWEIVGAVDGAARDPTTGAVEALIEVKTRASPRTMHEFIPDKDFVQVQTYMAMSGVQACWYVQQLSQRYLHREAFASCQEKTRIQLVEFDAAVWAQTILPAVEDFVRDVRRLIRGSRADARLRAAVFNLAVDRSPRLPRKVPERLVDEPPVDRLPVLHRIRRTVNPPQGWSTEAEPSRKPLVRFEVESLNPDGSAADHFRVEHRNAEHLYVDQHNSKYSAADQLNAEHTDAEQFNSGYPDTKYSSASYPNAEQFNAENTDAGPTTAGAFYSSSGHRRPSRRLARESILEELLAEETGSVPKCATPSSNRCRIGNLGLRSGLLAPDNDVVDSDDSLLQIEGSDSDAPGLRFCEADSTEALAGARVSDGDDRDDTALCVSLLTRLRASAPSLVDDTKIDTGRIGKKRRRGGERERVCGSQDRPGGGVQEAEPALTGVRRSGRSRRAPRLPDFVY